MKCQASETDSVKQVCERCGMYREGRTKIMVYRVLEKFPASPIAKEFYCNRCLLVMRVYAIVGLGLVLSMLGILLLVFIWIRSLS
jgi:hypothetical protein